MHRRPQLLTIVVFWVLIFWTIPALAADSEARDLAKGKSLYRMKCAKCHKFHNPKDYDDEEWGVWMGKMRKKAHLTDEQYDLISRYLSSLRSAK